MRRLRTQWHDRADQSARRAMRRSAAPFLRHGEQVHAVFAGQAASPWVAALGGPLSLLRFSRYRIVVVTSDRIVVLDTGQTSRKTARAVLAELPRSTRLGPAAGAWHTIPAGGENIQVHRRFFADIDTADVAVVMT